jgi:hypothetical protein
MPFLQLISTFLFWLKFVVDGVRIWFSGCLLQRFGCRSGGIQSCAIAIFLRGLGVEICFSFVI